jgi:hypothetical protein
VNMANVRSNRFSPLLPPVCPLIDKTKETDKILQKAAKQIARRNITILNRTHLISFSVHVLFLLIRIFLRSSPRSSYILYGALSFPSIVFELYLERLGRPSFAPDGEMRRSGEDLEAKGLTEYMWDIVYWTWGCLVVAAVLGDRAWWLWVSCFNLPC